MNTFNLKLEQNKLSKKIIISDRFSKIKTIGGAECFFFNSQLLACVTVCEFPSMKLLEKKTYILNNPLPYQQGFNAYREMPAIIEAVNLLEEEPDVLLVNGCGITHPRKLGLASHLSLSLNIPTIGITSKLLFGKIQNGKIILDNEVRGFEVKTKEHSKPIYVSPGNLISLGSCLNIISKTIIFPHKMPEPLHIAHKIAKKSIKNNLK